MVPAIAAPIPDAVAAQVRELGTVACVFAHPDDEAYLAGGLMAAARGLGQRVRSITATAGELGGDGATRRAELAAALAGLGVDDHHVLGLPDGGCHRVDAAEAVARLAALLAGIGPDTIVTFDPEGHTGHPDHIAVAHWTAEAARRHFPQARLLRTACTDELRASHPPALDPAEVYGPGLPVVVPAADLALDLRLDGELLDRKVAALEAHRSQTAPLIERVGRSAFRRWVAIEAFTQGRLSG
jgi:LmbE family N-acetylglucosaminyl deacetylase